MTEPVATAPGWDAPEAHPTLAPGEVHVWWSSLELPPPAHDALSAALTPAERARAARIVIPEKARHKAASRAVLRALLGAYLRVPPAEITLAAGAQGKPRLAPRHASDLRFNVSHAGAAALFAVGSGRELGVDLESIRRSTDTAAVGRRFFAPAEQAAIERLPQAERALAFYRCWTRKEAYLKLTGTGISAPLAGFEVSVGAGAALLSVGGSREVARGVTLLNIDAGPDHAACLALEGDVPSQLRLLRFQPPAAPGVL